MTRAIYYKYIYIIKYISGSSELTKCDPEAIIYKQEFQKNKDALISVLFKLFNEEVFDNKVNED